MAGSISMSARREITVAVAARYRSFHGLEPEPGTIHVGILRPLFGRQFFEFVCQFHPACLPVTAAPRSDRGVGIDGLDGADPLGLGGSPVDVLAERGRWLLHHARSIASLGSMTGGDA
jgi:hypothetical protein